MSTAYGTRPGQKERVTVYSRAYDHHGGGGERVARVIDQRDKQGCCHWWSRKVRCCGMTCRYKTCGTLCFCQFLVWLALFIFAIIILRATRKLDRAPTAGYPMDGLETGIHWYGMDNAQEKAYFNQTNKYYDPSKPTVIFVHGWSPDSAVERFRYTYQYNLNDPLDGADVNVANSWIEDGWNAGIFYWSQLADEDDVENAEVKIYTTESPVGMRWRETNGTYSEVNAPTVNVTSIFVKAYQEAMWGRTELTPIHIVGHSLGTQIAAQSTARIKAMVDAGELAPELMPNRLTLCDPYTSSWEVSDYLSYQDYIGGSTPAEMIVIAVQDITANSTINVAQFQTTDLGYLAPDATENWDMWQYTAFTFLTPTYISVFSEGPRHDSAFNLYFWSYASVTLPLTTTGERIGPSARSNDSMVAALMNDKTHGYWQVGGRDTPDPSDDVFDLVPLVDIEAGWWSLGLLVVLAVVASICFISTSCFTCYCFFHIVKTKCLQDLGVDVHRGYTQQA